MVIYIYIVFCVFILFSGYTTASELVRLLHVHFEHEVGQSGVVQLNINGIWQIVCTGQSGNKESKVLCQELGHEDGVVLPDASYGTVDGYYSGVYIACDSEEDYFGNCSLVENNNCSRNYLAVSCFNQSSIANSTDLSISSGLSYGKLDWYDDKYKATGQICSSFWDLEEAQVACRQLGYNGGLPTWYQKDNNLPFLLNNINCNGQEHSLSDCNKTTTVCQSKSRAGVVCFSSSGYNVSISDGGDNHGRVNIEIDGQIGTICDTGWSNKDAEVICISVGFVTGRKWSGPVQPGQGDVYMSDVDCTGKETFITECPSPGWKNITDENCLNHTKDAGVICYHSVRLSGGGKNDNIYMGRVEVYQNTEWTNLCTTKFDDVDAYVICRQLGYFRARTLSSGLFGRSPYSSFTTDISCHGDEKDILDCSHKMADCDYSEYASVVCINENVTDDFQIYIDNGYTGEVRVLQYGVVGTVCQDGWDNNDAKVLCHQNGYLDGQIFGTIKLLSQADPIWLTEVSCKGNEDSITQCDVLMNTTHGCSSKLQPAGVICYNGTGMELRLVGSTPGQGRVEIGRDGVWGTVCDNQWTTRDAIVVCEQLGFGGGSGKKSSFYGSGTGPVFMDSMQCDGTESSIFSCPNKGWGMSDSACSGHGKDAGVACKPWMQISSDSKGFVSVWKRSTYKYGLVCADNFDDTAATVVCKELTNYNIGISHCCSAYGPKNQPFVINHINCTGEEKSLQQCNYITADSCQSGMYASVICTNYIPTPGSGIRVQIIGHDRGYISVDYASYSGIICSEGFDNRDATVICKQEGYAVGISYKHYTATPDYIDTIRWLSHVNCNGSETYLHECSDLNWGKIGNCSVRTAAGVVCSNNITAPADVSIRLVNGSSTVDGRVEINVLGQWATITSNSFTQSEALVACRMAGFNSRIIATLRNYGNGELSPLITFVTCSGSEESLMDCALEVTTMNPRDHDLGVVCRTAPPTEVKLRLSGGSNYLEGRVEVEVYGQWGTICSSSSISSEANVICHMLGFPNGTGTTYGQFGLGGLISPGLSNIKCSGSELTIVDCLLEVALPNTVCPVVGVICDAPVRLENGGEHYGKLEIYHEGSWWAVNPEGVSGKDTEIICHELGYENGMNLCCNPFGTTTYNKTLYSVDCNNTVSTLGECTMDKFYNKTDYHGDYTSILCYSNKPSDFTEIKLQDDNNFGEVKMTSFGIEGYLCSETWSDIDALVTCRQLGYSNGSAYYHLIEEADGRMYWILHFQCIGYENRLNECTHSLLRSDRSCLDKHTTAVYCYNQHSIKYRLVTEETNSDHGRVEIRLNGQWNAICGTDWDNDDATVLCRELGYSTGEATNVSVPSNTTGEAYDVRYECSGRESSMEECPHSTWRNSTSDRCRHHKNDAGVQCYHSVIKTTSTTVRTTYLKEDGTTWVWIVTAVLAIIISIIIVIIVCRRNNVITRCRSDSQNSQSFDNSVIKISRDGSVHAVNPLAVSGNDPEYDLPNTKLDEANMPSLCKQDDASGYAYVKIKRQSCEVCKTVKSDDYLTVVFQKSFKGQKLDNQNSQEITKERLHVCPGCAIMGGDGQACVSTVNSQIENNIKGSIDNSENLKTADSKPLNVDVHNRNECSPHNSGYLTVVFNDPKTKDLDKNEGTCKNEKSSMKESIKSMSSQGEIGYPIMVESSEL